MKMIVGAFNNYDIELLSNKIFCDYLLRTLSQFALKLKKFKKKFEKFQKKIRKISKLRFGCTFRLKSKSQKNHFEK